MQDANSQQLCPSSEESQKDQPTMAAEDSEQRELTKAQLLLKRLLAAHETWYDVTRGYTLAGRTFPGLAAYHEYGEQYVLVKRAKLWAVGQHEYIFFDIVDRLEEEAFQDTVQFLKTEALKLVDPVPDHMSTNISMVLIAESISDEAAKVLRKTSFRKNYMFGIRGWSDLCLVGVDLSAEPRKQVISNAAGKKLAKTVAANLNPAAKLKK